MKQNYQTLPSSQEKLNPAALLPLKLGIIRYFLGFKSKKIYVSHTTLAKHFGKHRSTILRALRDLFLDGWIEKTRREWNTCLYEVTDEAKAERYRISHLWKQLKWLAPLSLSLLFPITKPGATPYSSKVINNYIYITNARARNEEEDMKQDRNAWKKQYSLSMWQKMDADKQRKHREWLEKRGALEKEAQPVPKIVNASHSPRHGLNEIQSETVQYVPERHALSKTIHSVTKQTELIDFPVDDDSIWEEVF